MEGLLDPLDDEYLIFRLNLPYGVGVETFKGNLTRCQRAPKGTEQSTSCCSYQVIQSRGVRFFYFG